MLTSALDKKAALAAFVIGLLTILAAWASQIWGGLVPCELCLGERVPYYWGLPILAVILLLWNRLPLTVWYVGMLIVGAIFLWSVYLGVFHAGVEWKFWPGPTACTSSGTGLDLNQLNNLNAVNGSHGKPDCSTRRLLVACVFTHQPGGHARDGCTRRHAQPG